jgi:hypothetical protein
LRAELADNAAINNIKNTELTITGASAAADTVLTSLKADDDYITGELIDSLIISLSS